MRINRNLKEARAGNFSAKLRARVLKFLKDSNRPDIFIMDKESNVSIIWQVDCGRTDLIFSFSPNGVDSYTIDCKDSNKEKIESWSGELSELQMDLEDTIDFIDEFKGSITPPTIKKESKMIKNKRAFREALGEGDLVIPGKYRHYLFNLLQIAREDAEYYEDENRIINEILEYF
jgi:hypothetical protein